MGVESDFEDIDNQDNGVFDKSEMEQVLEKAPVTKKKKVDRKGKGGTVVQKYLSEEKTTVYTRPGQV
jgi:hypothetical protein